MSEESRSYLEKVYASWLGKVIGVRLGSPVENWSSEKIMETYPDEEGYLVDYDIYAADDDLNGPLFFVRALLDYDDIDAEKIGETFLNYLEEYRGFFWWGGVGVSTEHTAYENLKNGLMAPESGSALTNGLTMAEQIGGQIFSDCWGYVALEDPELAKKLAVMASSVTHDRNGIEGGIFVATAIALAMRKDDIHEVITEALEYLNKDLEYCKVAKDIIGFYENNKDDWTKCLNYIQEHYGYDKYPGVCHIIPNMALMIMAMSYGDNDFDRTLIILNRSGWDTDCNCGNVGSIMGALLGLKGISEKWITPIDDIVNASSAIGCLNIQSVSGAAKMFTKLAYRLKNEPEPEFPYFVLPYGTNGFRCRDGKIEVRDDALQVDSQDIYRYVYYLTDDLYDARYDPEFSPVLEPGDQLEIKISSEMKQELITYVKDCDGTEYESVHEAKGDALIVIDVPTGKNIVINLFGIRAKYPYRIIDIKVNRRPKLHYEFSEYPLEHYGPRYGGDCMNNIRAFVRHSGDWDIADGLKGESEEHALISSGNYGNGYDRIEWTFIPEKGRKHYLVFDMTGYLHYEAIGFRNVEIVHIRKQIKEKTLKSYPYAWKNDEEYHFLLKKEDGVLKLQVNDTEFEFEGQELKDLFGISMGEAGVSKTRELKLY